MAPEGLMPTLRIDEPSTPGTPSSASLVTSSPDISSSPNSYNSSRPPSQASSQTSISTLPSSQEGQSRNLENEVLQDSFEMQSLPPSTLNIPSVGVTPAASPTASQDESTRLPQLPSPSDTSNSRQDVDQARRDSWFQILRRRIHERRWLENTIGVLSVITALWLGVRGYKLAVWQSWNDMRQTCAAYKQVDDLETLQRTSTYINADRYFFGS